MLLGNAYVQKPVGIGFLKIRRTSAKRHGGCKGHNTLVPGGKFNQRFVGNGAIGPGAGGAYLAILHQKRRRAVKGFRLAFCPVITVALFG